MLTGLRHMPPMPALDAGHYNIIYVITLTPAFSPPFQAYFVDYATPEPPPLRPPITSLRLLTPAARCLQSRAADAERLPPLAAPLSLLQLATISPAPQHITDYLESPLRRRAISTLIAATSSRAKSPYITP